MSNTYRHEAFLWHDTDEFLAGTVPFIRDGLTAGEPVMVALIEDRTAQLRDALGTDADDVSFVDMTELGRNPIRIIPAWRQFIDSHAALRQPIRGIGEPISVGCRPEEIVESQLHEALLNSAVEPDTPFWLMCPYDAGRLDPAVIEEAYRSHPAVIDAKIYRGSHLYGGRDHVDVVFGTELPSLAGDPASMSFAGTDLHQVSAFVAPRVHAAGLAPDRAAQLAVAVFELASSSIQRGAAGGDVRIWTRNDAVICEVHDDVVVKDPLIGRKSPRGERDGLRVASELCDLVQMRSTLGGTTVRVHNWL